MGETHPPLRVCSKEERPEAMDALILMGESLCAADRDISLHLTVPDAPDSVRAWARSRPEVVLSTARLEGVTGWDYKPWLLLQELSEGKQEVLWLDSDMIVTAPVSRMLLDFPRDSLIFAEEWTRAKTSFSQFWGLTSVRPVVFSTCFIRATQAHRPLLERWAQMTRDPRYREAQALPIEQRPIQVLGDQPLFIALLESEEFCHVPFDCIRLGRHIAQCAGSSGYQPHDRLLDLFRGLPALIHVLGRKPWDSPRGRSRIQRYLLDLATDVSPYVLAGRRVARRLDMHDEWLEARTSLGAILRGLTAGHPAMAGLPLAIPHALFKKVGQIRWGNG